MEKIDLRELNKMTKTFRSCHRALKRINDGEEMDVVFWSAYGRGSTSVPIIDADGFRNFIVRSLDSEVAKLKKRFAEMGIDPLDVDGRRKKKTSLRVAK